MPKKPGTKFKTKVSGRVFDCVVDEQGTYRFRCNKIVRDLLTAAQEGRKLDLNDLARGGYSKADYQEFYALIGYSICGFGEIFPTALIIEDFKGKK